MQSNRKDVGGTIAPKLLSVRDSASALGVSIRLIWSLIARGELRKVQVGRRVMLAAEDLADFVARGGAR